MDTAGMRKVKGEVERIGVHLTEKKLANSDLSLVVIDQSRPLSKDDLAIIAKCQKQKSLIIINKIDLPSRFNEEELMATIDGFSTVRISALTGEGIDDLRKAIRVRVMAGNVDTTSSQIAPNLRHTIALKEASQYFKNAVSQASGGSPLEIIAMDLNSGLEDLGEIIGETTNEEILQKIFSEFCLGK
jgi:tRNA modification GTPase